MKKRKKSKKKTQSRVVVKTNDRARNNKNILLRPKDVVRFQINGKAFIIQNDGWQDIFVGSE